MHVAARNGHTHFAMEMMNLKPSFARKLNKSGFSPVHLALQNDYSRTVRAFMAMEKDLISVKGREMITPLHHVAKTGDTELLSEFLFICPSSIEDLTSKCETVVHLAVKHSKLEAFKVLLGWLKQVNKEEILNWKDVDGNTVFHIATSTNQIKVMKLLRKIVNVNVKNLDGQTAKDIFQSNCASLGPEIGKILGAAKAKAGRKLNSSATTLANYLSQNLSFMEKRNKLLGLNNLLGINKQGSRNTSDLRSSVLVVAILIVTATYQATISPPGGYWQDSTTVFNNNTVPEKNHKAGEMIMDPYNAVLFYGFNGIAFFFSTRVIMILIIGLPMWKTIYSSIVVLGVASFASLYPTFPFTDAYRLDMNLPGFVIILRYPIVTGFVVFVPYVAFVRNERRRQQVDFPVKYFSKSPGPTW
ncbi:PREDICTED: ankyrin repeat-containing protein At2g01680-like [Tarenaya hassleriana]|uniref:ankyrin repeat-containing protein At2g01680-like n=1 Tax=Tarenaya hassleriana TaxID=28532 RepID=UPI0008FD868E|nr:PREDICTED: ankyrin repeat-containing protein At2g01680-like [Tarenaya hassleriana]